MVIHVNLAPPIPALPRLDDKTHVDVRYSLIAPYANAHIYWDAKSGELIYEVEEPLLNYDEKQALSILEDAMIELVNINVAVDKTIEKMIEYIDKTARLLISELNLNIPEASYEKLFYYFYRDFVGFNQIDPLTRDYFIEDIECNGVNAPLYVVHRLFRNVRTNIIFKEVEELASFVEKLAQRCGRYISYAQPLLDGTLADGSIDYNEPVVYRENGIVKMGKIGTVIDKHYEQNTSNKPVPVEKIEVVAFDKKSFKLGWRPAQYVYRHKIKEDLFKLDLEFGRHVQLTGNHSIFVVRPEGVVAERTDGLKVGDYVVLPSKLPGNNVVTEIALAEKLARSSQKSKIILKNVPHEIYQEHKEALYTYYRGHYEHPNQAYYEHKNKKILPIELYQLIPEQALRKCFIGTTSPHSIPTFLQVTKTLVRFLGLYIAEGWLYDHHSHGIYLCFNKREENLIKEVQEAARECFNLMVYVEPPQGNGVKVKIDGLLPWLVMKEVLEVTSGAHIKRVPEIIFNISQTLQQDFIAAWHAGDYSTTVSEELANDIAYLALFNEDIAAFYKSKPKKTFIKGKEICTSGAYYSNFYARKTEHPYPTMIPMEVFNPLNKTHMRLGNKRVERARMARILHDMRYRRFSDLEQAPQKFLSEWEKRGFVKDKVLTGEGTALVHEIETVRKLMTSDFCFARINKISRVKPVGDYVYDFSVAGDENFVGGTGGIFCHNSRVNATYTKDVTSRGPTFTIRKFTKVPWTPTQLLAMNTLSPEILAYFWLLLQYKGNLMIAGGTSSGKTTLLNAIAFFIPPEARVISIEDTRELNLPRENWLPAVARTSVGVGKVGEVDLFDLLKNSFRQNPDYVIVGEVRGKEAFVLFQGMASGHSSMSTIHADSLDTLVRRLQTPPISLSPTLMNSLDCVVIMTHALRNNKHTRRLKEIVEVVSIDKEGTALINTPFSWDPAKDVFYFKKQSKVLEKISARYGISLPVLQGEFVKRTKLLYALFQRRVFGFDEMRKIIMDYYREPAEVLKAYGIT